MVIITNFLVHDCNIPHPHTLVNGCVVMIYRGLTRDIQGVLSELGIMDVSKILRS